MNVQNIRRSLAAVFGALMMAGMASADASEADAAWKETAYGADMTPVSRVRVSPAEKKAVWTAFRRQFGDLPVQMGRTVCVATNASVRLCDQAYVATNDVRYHVGFELTARSTTIRYLFAEGMERLENAGRDQVCKRIMDFVPGKRGAEALVRMSQNVLGRGKTVVKGDISGQSVSVPFDESWFVFIDDYPEMDWGHAAKGVFVAKDLSSAVILFVNEPLTVYVDSVEVGLETVSGTSSVRVKLAAASALGAPLTGSKEGFPALTDAQADSSRCYALLVCGGVRKADNHCRYWKEMCFVYNVVRQRYGLPRGNIKVLWASGDPYSDLCDKTHCNQGGNCRTGFDESDLDDFDRDGNADINGAATAANIVAAFKWYRENLKANDQLIVYFTDHGSRSAGKACICIWSENTALFAQDLADMTKDIACPVMFALKTCYSGGMISAIQKSAPNRAIATSDGMSSSWGYVWTHNFFGALCGSFPMRTQKLNSTALGVDPRTAGEACSADTDGDGRVSFREAHEYALRANPFTYEAGYDADGIDSPQYQQSENTPKLFLTQYADTQPVVREKVATPTLGPSAATSRFAPYTVTASCATPGATVRYTLDGSEPNEKSACVGAGIVLTKDCTVSARAYKSGMDGSAVVRAEYKVRKTAPEAPYLTAVTLGDSSTGVIVNWISGDGTTGIDILRGENASMSGARTVVTGLSPDDIAYADMTAAPGKTYYYQVRATNAYGSSLSAVSRGAGLQLMPPSGLKATASNVKLTTADVSLSWNAVAGATHYRVWRVAGDGTVTAVSGWTAAQSLKDTVSYKSGGATFSYYVKAAGDASGANASPACASVPVSVKPDSSSWSLVFATSSWSTEEATRTAVKPGKSVSMCVRLKYADGTYEKKTFLSGIMWSVASGHGLTLTGKDGRYSAMWEGSEFISPYTPPEVTVAASAGTSDHLATVRASYTTGGTTVSGEFQVVVSASGVIKSLSFWGPDFIVPGESVAYDMSCTLYGDSSWNSDLPEGTEVEWSIVEGSGITLDQDGVATGWTVSKKTTATIQAKVNTILGPVSATKKVSISPSTIRQMRAVIPPTGGESENYVGPIDSQTYGEWVDADWINGVTYYGSGSTTYNDKSVTISLGKGRNLVSVGGKNLFFSFRADRNAELTRTGMFKLRWDGGGIDFAIEQQPAPTANAPKISVDSNGLSASAQKDGSVVRYATDGEEPSETSPVLDGAVNFTRNTPVAVKAFGEWMLDSETVYGDVEGGEKVATANVTFDPVESDVKAPASRTYKVTDTFGELPTLSKSGLYFHGWTLYRGSSKRVSESDYVPEQDAVLYARWSRLREDEPEWTALAWNFKSSSTGFVKVYDLATETWLTTAIVGVEDGDGLCRGSSKNGFGDWQDPRNGVDGLSVFGIYGQVETGAENGLKFRVWLPGRGYVTVMNDDVSYVAGVDLGSATNPHVINVMTFVKPDAFAFESHEATAAKGDAFVLTVVGGNDESAASVKVNVAYGSAKASDLVLKNATVMGANGVEQTNLTFPLTLNWAKGDMEPKTITIPVAVGKATDAPKFLAWNLSEAKGLALGEMCCCFGRIGAGASYNGDDVYVLPYVGDVSGGKVSGGASVKPDGKGAYKAATLKATPNKGYWFAGWYDAWGNWVSGDLSYKLTPSGSDLEAYEARFVPEKPSLCATYNGYARVNLKGMTLVKGAKTVEDVIGEYPLTATLSAAGKLSGSVTVGGKKVAFAADGCYEASDEGSWVTYRFNVDEKAWFGVSNVETLQLEISRWKADDGRYDEYGVARLGGVSASGEYAPLGDEQSGFAYRLAGKEDLGLLKPFAGTYAVAISADGGVIPLSVSVDASGKVKASGKHFDGTAVSATGTMSYRYCWETGNMPEDANEEAALVSLFFSPKALGSGIVHVLFRCSHDQGEGYCRPDASCTVTEYTAGSVGAMVECDWDASPYTTGCWVPTDPELADPNYGAVRLTTGDDVIDILYASKNGAITGLGSATTSGVTVKFDAKTSLFTVTKGKSYMIQGVLGAYEWDCRAAGRINADGSYAHVDVEFVTLPQPEENFPWTDDGFVLTLGQNFGEAMQPSVTSADAPLGLTIAGLPSGLKFDKTTGLITGAPTKSGTSTVKVSYKYGSRTITRETTLVVSAKPEGLPMGTYVGTADVLRYASPSEGYVEPIRCPLTVTIDKNGALTGSITLFGKKTTLKASGYDAFADGYSTYKNVTLDLKAVDKTWKTATVKLTVGENDMDGSDAEGFGDGRVVCLMAYRDQSKDADFASRVAPFVGNYVAALTTQVDVEDDQVGVTVLSVTVDQKGTAKVAGTYVDGSAFSATATVVPYDNEYSRWAQIIVVPTLKTLAQGSLGLSITLTEGENEETGESEIVVQCEGMAAKYTRANGEYVEAAFSCQNFAYAYSSLAWVDGSVDPEETCLWVGCDNAVFVGSYFAWKTKVRICGPEIIGVDKQLSGPKMTFKLDDKTGLFSGSCGTYKIFGAMEKGTCEGVGTVVGKDGSIGIVWIEPMNQ